MTYCGFISGVLSEAGVTSTKIFIRKMKQAMTLIFTV